MPKVLTAAVTLLCPHGGTVAVTPANTRVKAAGALALTAADTFVVAGCPFLLVLVPHPCVRVEWLMPARKLKAGAAVLTDASVGLCVAADNAPQGPATVAGVQPKVSGT